MGWMLKFDRNKPTPGYLSTCLGLLLASFGPVHGCGCQLPCDRQLCPDFQFCSSALLFQLFHDAFELFCQLPRLLPPWSLSHAPPGGVLAVSEVFVPPGADPPEGDPPWQLPALPPPPSPPGLQLSPLLPCTEGGPWYFRKPASCTRRASVRFKSDLTSWFSITDLADRQHQPSPLISSSVSSL